MGAPASVFSDVWRKIIEKSEENCKGKFRKVKLSPNNL